MAISMVAVGADPVVVDVLEVMAEDIPDAADVEEAADEVEAIEPDSVELAVWVCDVSIGRP